ncbi:MAG: hypothetical protein ACXVP0_14615 [Bacteroidia bacterium]
MKKFLLTFCKFLIVPLIAVLLLLLNYFISDPFKVIHHYNDYSYPVVVPDRDYISTQVYINNHDRYHYNSFIFGSSRTLAFKVDSWKKYLDHKAHPYVFDAASESLAGIYQKIKYLDSTGADMDNALVLLCRDCSFLNTINDKGHLIIKHPATSHKSTLAFNCVFLDSYFDNQFLIRYLIYQCTKTFKPWMHGYIDERKIKYDPVSNELSILDQEAEITDNETGYYNKRRAMFYTRKGERIDSVPIIKDIHKNYLTEIKSIFIKKKTNYKVVLSPLYEQKKFNPADMSFLNGLFADRLYDFSGKNQFTDNYKNFYEISHYRPLVGDSILARIYK